IAELQHYRTVGITTFAEADRYDRERLARERARADRLMGPTRNGSAHRGSVPPGGDSNQSYSASKSGSMGRRPVPLNLANAQSLHLLTPAEQALCSTIRILPVHFLGIKETLVRECVRRGGKLRRREARELVRIDVHKTGQIWDLLVRTGVLKLAPDIAPATDAGIGSASQDDYQVYNNIILWGQLSAVYVSHSCQLVQTTTMILPAYDGMTRQPLGLKRGRQSKDHRLLATLVHHQPRDGYSLDSQQSLYGAPQGPNAAAVVYEQERKTIAELLLPEAPPSEKTKPMLNADSLNPPEVDVLAMALGAPARRVLQRADALGPRTGWRDGYLSTHHGFCPPDPSAAPIALAASRGRVWSDLCARLPGLVSRGKCREAILALPLVLGTSDVIPDAALWAAVVCLGILASTYRYEERNDGHEGLVRGAAKSAFFNAAGDEDEEPETKGVPRVVTIPLRQICTRLGRPLPYLSQSDVSIYNFKLRDHTSVTPYLERIENMDLRWPVFHDRGEAMFLLCMADSHGCFTPAVDLIATCQERVMERDNEGLLDALVKLKAVVDQLPYVFHKISVNPGSELKSSLSDNGRVFGTNKLHFLLGR
ncbi:hypothetical protein FRC07_002460, partial [Ceratobasidium sp. 392]